MKIVTDWRAVAPDLRGAAVAIGNFDGLHLGHQALLSATRRQAQALGAPFGVVTFEPHPRAFFAPEAPPFRLTPARAKAHILQESGVEILHQVDFDAELAAMTPEAFVDQVLVEGLGISHLAAGADFRFGAGRAGDMAFLARVGPERGFSVQSVALIEGPQGVELSSSAARRALAEGRPEEAARILGRPHRIEGVVSKGDQRGRTIGFPTANLGLDGLQPLAFGVYAVRARLAKDSGEIGAGVEEDQGGRGPLWKGVANLGLRPTFAGAAPRLEVHLFDVDEDLYGRTLIVEMIAFLRPERRFDGLEALKAQIRTDSLEARRLLAEG
ncbi:bifunctional riboflavin kinase/FAD synthetase [Neomegalonema sp.]|uniref:bifunctional riboflavin kinase/FAD synthetase n=1 Tax=Neomegalonema sp. TaxID=2039713 RepID=UPI00262CBE94|nr:bifunctional riboflavin kinase/FAD synthetase [Neomegalonema sp.]MDD2869824.1 bifunctional riboflavin kinase/FAD synthetase [Neomegalonema sp.]